MAKDKHEVNEVGYGVFNTGKPGNTNLHPGAPQREVGKGRIGGKPSESDDTSVFPSQTETGREKANQGNDPGAMVQRN